MASQMLSATQKKKKAYVAARLRCEKLGLPPALLDEISFNKRVQLNLMDNFANHLNPYGDQASSFKLTDVMLQKLDLAESRDDFWYIDTEDALEEMCSIILEKSTIAFDLETDTEYSYHMITSLIQISCDTCDFVIDAIKLYSKIKFYLAPIFSSSNILKLVFGTSDLLALQRDFDMFTCSVIDVQKLHLQLTTEKKVSFQEIVKNYLGIEIDKENQLFFFRLRELPRDVLEYAVRDSRYLLFVWEKIKELHLDYLKNSLDYSHHRYFSLRVYIFPPKSTVDESWTASLQTLKDPQKVLFTRDKYFETFERLWKWRDNTAKLRDLRPKRVISDYDMAYLCVVKPKEIKMLDFIWRNGVDNDEDCKESICAIFRSSLVTSEESWENERYIDNKIVIIDTANTAETEDSQIEAENIVIVIDNTENCEKMDCDKDKTENVSNEKTQVTCDVSKLRTNPYDNVICVKEVSDFDLLYHFELLRQSRMPRRVLNQLRRKRQRMRHEIINTERTSLGLEVIPFKDLIR